MAAERMMRDRVWVRSHFWLAVALVVMSGLFVLGAQPFAVGIAPAPYDKLAHALLFGFIFLVLDSALALPLWLALLLPLLVSGADELHQLFLPGRHPGFSDWLAGVCGVSLAACWRYLR